MTEIISDVKVGQYWELLPKERDSLTQELTRRVLARMPYELWMVAEHWVSSCITITGDKYPDVSVYETVDREIRIREFAYKTARHLDLWEILADLGPAGSYQGHVYFLRAGDFIKIGFTAGDVQKRIKELRTGCPYKQTLIGLRESTMATEARLHKVFVKDRANLEWFRASEIVLKCVQELSDDSFDPYVRASHDGEYNNHDHSFLRACYDWAGKHK